MHKALQTRIIAPIRPGTATQLEQRVLTWGEQDYLFLNSEERSIMADHREMTLTIIWSEEGPPDHEQWQHDLQAFQESLSDLVVWDHATETTQLIEVFL